MSLTPFNFPVSATAQVVLMLVMASPSLGPNVHFSTDPVHMNSIFKKHERLSRNQQALLQHRFLVLIEIEFFFSQRPVADTAVKIYTFVKEIKVTSPDLHP